MIHKKQFVSTIINLFLTLQNRCTQAQAFPVKKNICDTSLDQFVSFFLNHCSLTQHRNGHFCVSY